MRFAVNFKKIFVLKITNDVAENIGIDDHVLLFFLGGGGGVDKHCCSYILMIN